MASCPDCDEMLYVPLRCHFTLRGGFLTTEIRVDPVTHQCGQSYGLDDWDEVA